MLEITKLDIIQIHYQKLNTPSFDQWQLKYGIKQIYRGKINFFLAWGIYYLDTGKDSNKYTLFCLGHQTNMIKDYA